jgi:hypothetical protein
MSRRLTVSLLAICATAHNAFSQDVTTTDPAPTAPPNVKIAERELAAEIGIAAGGRTTTGGLRFTGRLLYQLSSQDWFEGTANFTFGTGGAECFRDRDNVVVCEHGLLSGRSASVGGGIRRYFFANTKYTPFARLAAAFGVSRFSTDELTGLTVTLHGGGGMRVAVANRIAVVVVGDVALGAGTFNRNVGTEPQLGFALSMGAEFALP